VKLILKIREAYQRCEPWFKASERTLAILQSSRGDGLIAKALGLFSITGAILKAALPEESVDAFLRQRRFRNGSYQSIGGFVCELLLERLQPTATLSVGMNSQLFLWEKEEGSIAAIFHDGNYGDGPLTRDGDDELLSKIVQALVWNERKDLMLSAQPTHFWRSYKKYRLVEMPEPESYIGSNGPNALAQRLDCYGDAPRTILLRGTTGVGKSILARQTARLLHRGSGRTLKIAGSVLRDCQFDELLSLVRLLRPSVLLLDDLNLDDQRRVDDFLLLLESLRDPGSLVFVTMMTNEEPKAKPKMGDAYFPGMRPGRIDEVYSIRLPNESQRRNILHHYYGRFHINRIPLKTHDQIARATKGLSGAYLSEIVRRLAIHGVDNWAEEVSQVIAAAPCPENGRNDRTIPKAGNSGKMIPGSSGSKWGDALLNKSFKGL